MGRASNRKWRNRWLRIRRVAASAVPSNQREAWRLMKLFGEHRRFLKVG